MIQNDKFKRFHRLLHVTNRLKHLLISTLVIFLNVVTSIFIHYKDNSLCRYKVRSGKTHFYCLYFLSDEKCRTYLYCSKGIIECAYINSSAIYHSVPEKLCIIFKHCAYVLEVNRYFLNNIRCIS